MKFRILIFVLLGGLAITPLFSAQQNGVTVRDTTVHKKPFNDADITGKLTTDSAVAIIKRKGGWYKIKSGKDKGWVRMTSLRLDRFGKNGEANNKGKGKSANKGVGIPSSADSLGDLLTSSLFSPGRGATTQSTAATGIKGLDEELLKNAEPNIEALELLEKYAINEETAKLFAKRGGIESQNLDYFGKTAAVEKKAWTDPDAGNNEDEDSL